MKRSFIVICIILCLLLCACSTTKRTETPTEPSQSTEESTEKTTYRHFSVLGLSLDLPVNSAYQGFMGGDDSIMAAIVNEPFTSERTPTVTWQEGEYDRLYIIPRYVGTRVDVYEILWDEDGQKRYSDEPVYSATADDGCIIYSALERPEGMPRWYIEVVATENEFGGMELQYDGRDGTAPIEYIYGSSYIYYTSDNPEPEIAKPVIYLYPEEETQVSVKLDYPGDLTCTYPAYQNGWTVTARPDGTLTDASGQVYNYLYWEGKGGMCFDFSEGFCVKGGETAAFLEDALAQLGLNRREANEFIVYWLPLMQENAYNVISFQTDTYTEAAPLTVTPTPDTLIRVYMAWYASEEAVRLAPQSLSAPERSGFTVVEWGGSEIIRNGN